MKIGVIGGGSVGLLFAPIIFRLSRSDCIDEGKEQAEAIEAEGIRLYKGGEEMRVNAGRTRVSIRTVTCLS